MSKDSVDILLATFNGFSFIASQLDSILSQTHREMHLYIRDDFSTDSTLKILEMYANRFPSMITLIPSQERLNVKKNFSFLMQQAKAQYILFADQDDVWIPEKVSRTLHTMKELENRFGCEKPLLVHTDLKVVDRDLKILSPSFWQYSRIDPTCQTLNRILMQNIVTGCTMMVNRPLLQLAGPIPEQCVMHDWWLALVASAFGKMESLPLSTVLYRQHGKNTLGAKKYLSINYFKEGFKKCLQPQKYCQEQAEELIYRYSPLLLPSQKILIEAYLSLPHLSFFKCAPLRIKHRLFKIGWMRNLFSFLLKN